MFCPGTRTSEFTQTNAETIFDSIIQYKFRNENVDIVNIFPNIMHSIADNDTKYIELVADIVKNLDDDFFKKYSQFKEIKGYEKEFISNIIKYIKSDDILQQENGKNILHIFTDYYIVLLHSSNNSLTYLVFLKRQNSLFLH